MNKPLNIGIIGIGRFGINYLRTFNELQNAQVKWICATKEATLNKASTEVKSDSNTKKTLNYKDILNDKDVDAVAIVTPGSTHYSLAKEALQSDKHVIVEKPLAFHSEDAKELIKISGEKNKILMVSHLHRFNPGIQKIKEDIEAGLFGKIRCIHSLGAGNGPVRSDMSALWDFFPHDISILTYLLGEYPLSVSTNGTSYIKQGLADVVTMDIKFSKNIFATAFGSWLYPLKRRDLVVIGEKLYATFDDYSKTEKLKYYAKDNKYAAQKINDTKPLTNQLQHFLDCMANNKTPLTGGNEEKAVSVLEAAQKSLENDGVAVEIEMPKLHKKADQHGL